MTLKINEIILKTAQKGLLIINKDTGAFPEGTNGPHDQITTPVRNTSHWVIIFLHAYKLSNKQIFYDAAVNSLDYLISGDVRPKGYTFINRDYKNGDKCNGVIGQAWPIEALTQGYEVTSDCRYLNLAKKVYDMHKFDSKIGLWSRCDVDGSSLRSFDTTLNHQIWFAASAAMLSKHTKDKEIKRHVLRFLDNFEQNALITEDGRFKMPINPWSFLKSGYISLFIRTTDIYTIFRKAFLFKNGIKGAYLVLKDSLNNKKRRDFLTEMEIGYHAFHTYGLAMLKEVFPDHPAWQCKKVSLSLDYLTNKKFIESVMSSQYGIGYNPPGIEIAYSMDIFRDELNKDIWNKEMISNLLKMQFDKTYDFSLNEMNKVKYDKDTYSARLYEICRISNEILNTEIEWE